MSNLNTLLEKCKDEIGNCKNTYNLLKEMIDNIKQKEIEKSLDYISITDFCQKYDCFKESTLKSLKTNCNDINQKFYILKGNAHNPLFNPKEVFKYIFTFSNKNKFQNKLKEKKFYGINMDN